MFKKQLQSKLFPVRLVLVFVLILSSICFNIVFADTTQTEVQFIFTSDAHYGITRDNFQGATKVDAHIVNAAMIAKMNTLPGMKFPIDGGINEGKTVGAIDFAVEGGDIANREEGTAEKAIQSAAASWKQFKTDYIDGLTLKDRNNAKAPLYIIPGNHDVTNAIGFYKPMFPEKDATSMAEIYNLMMKPATPLTKDTYDYSKHKIHYSVDMANVHFVFLTLWPDTSERKWMEEDLKKISKTTPVIIFVHDQPDIETKHLTNPNGAHDINKTDKFENMVVEQADVKTVGEPSTNAQKGLESFIKAHANISAYFHGNDNWQRFNQWTGPNNTIALNRFVVDSPMKGNVSAEDETKLAFYVVTINSKTRTMTVRDCLWNTNPAKADSPIAWGNTVTVALYPRLANK
jgi:hypothetical protein